MVSVCKPAKAGLKVQQKGSTGEESDRTGTGRGWGAAHKEETPGQQFWMKSTRLARSATGGTKITGKNRMQWDTGLYWKKRQIPTR